MEQLSDYPQEQDAQYTGRTAGHSFVYKMPRSWVEKFLDGDTDYGIDGVIQYKTQLSGVKGSFYLQLKGTRSPKYVENNDFITHTFKTRTLRKFHNEQNAVMVAIASLSDKSPHAEDKVYYLWLDEDFFIKNRDAIDKNETLTIRIPTENLLSRECDFTEFLDKQIELKHAVGRLKHTAGEHGLDVAKIIKDLSEFAKQKPYILEVAADSKESPWVKNKDDSTAEILRETNSARKNNNLTLAVKNLSKLNSSELNGELLAEYWFQASNNEYLLGDKQKALELAKKSAEVYPVKRYQNWYSQIRVIASKLTSKLIREVRKELDLSDPQSRMIEAKILILQGKPEEAIELIKNSSGNSIKDLLFIGCAQRNSEDLEDLIRDISVEKVSDIYDLTMLKIASARVCFNQAIDISAISNGEIPAFGIAGHDWKKISECKSILDEAWDNLETLSYPDEIFLVLDISSIIYSIFGKQEELISRIKNIYNVRKKNIDIARFLAHLYFNNRDIFNALKTLEPFDLELEDVVFVGMCHYMDGKFSRVQKMVEDNKVKLFKDKSPHTTELLAVCYQVCLSVENHKLSKLIKGELRKRESGDAYIAISECIVDIQDAKGSSLEPLKRLMDAYEQQGRPTSIGIHVLNFLPPMSMENCEKIVEIYEELKKTHQVDPDLRKRIATAYLKLENYSTVLEISAEELLVQRNQTYWRMLRAEAAQSIGDINLMLNELLAIDSDEWESKFWVCRGKLTLGYFNSVIDDLAALHADAENEEQRKSALFLIMSTYAASGVAAIDIPKCMRQLSKIVDQENEQEEGSLLLHVLGTCNNISLEDDFVREFQDRLTKFVERFPNSKILRRGSIPENGSPEELLDALRQATGITEEQITQRKINRENIRSQKWPMPFSMIPFLIEDASDIFWLWHLGTQAGKSKLEYHFRHTSAVGIDQTTKIIEDKKPIFVDETSVVLLCSIGIFDKACKVFDLYISTEFYEKTSNAAMVFPGSLNQQLAKVTLDTLQENTTSISFYKVGENQFEFYKNYVENFEYMLTDDANQLALVNSVSNGDVGGINTCDFLDYLHKKKEISDNEYLDYFLGLLSSPVQNVSVMWTEYFDLMRILDKSSAQKIEEDLDRMITAVFSDACPLPDAFRALVNIYHHNYKVKKHILSTPTSITILKKFLLRYDTSFKTASPQMLSRWIVSVYDLAARELSEDTLSEYCSAILDIFVAVNHSLNSNFSLDQPIRELIAILKSLDNGISGRVAPLLLNALPLDGTVSQETIKKLASLY